MIQIFLSMALAGAANPSYEYVDSYKQDVDGVPCSIDALKLPDEPGLICLAHPPKKKVYGDYNVCTFLVSCYEIKRVIKRSDRGNGLHDHF